MCHLRLSEQFLDGRLERFWLGSGRVTLDDLAVLVDEELGKVPLDALGAEKALLLLLEPLENFVGFFAVDVRFLQINLSVLCG